MLVLGILYFMVYVTNGNQLTPRSIARFAESIFINVVFIQIFFTIWLVPACVAVGIAEEKERRTLTYLVMTRLSSAEIVVGKLAAGLVQFAAWLATGLPVVILIPIFGGVDPRSVWLATAATVSTAYFVAGLSIVVSTAAARAGKAVGEALGLAMLWVVVPILARITIPGTFPRLWTWVQPIIDWVLASSPATLVLLLWGGGISPGWRLFDALVWMIVLQVAGGSLLVLWAIARFRKACRHYEENSGTVEDVEPARPRLWTAIRRIAAVRRPPCWDSPILWKELCTARRRTLAEKLAVLVVLGFVALLIWVIFPFASRAILERFRYSLDPTDSEIRRMAFNEILRIITSLVEFFVILATAGIAATGLTEERARETWDSLLATPLAAREILQAKMIAAAWKVRWVALLLVALWLLGLLAGSIHPLGLGAALVLLTVSIWFAAALGIYASLVSRDTGQASNRALIPILLLSISFLACYLTPRHTSVVLGAGSAPFVNWLSLLSYADVREIVTDRGLKPFSVIRQLGLYADERPVGVLVAFLVTSIASIAAATWFSRAAVANFDRATGRSHTAVVPTSGESHNSAIEHGGWRDLFRRKRALRRCAD
jgi:ABC-type Na+ efflux pump permease subunit